MNNSSCNLLDFLKRKSIFAESPTKNSRKRLKSILRGPMSNEKRPNQYNFDKSADEQQILAFEKTNPFFIGDKQKKCSNNYNWKNQSRHQVEPIKIKTKLAGTNHPSRHSQNLLQNLQTSQVKKVSNDHKLWDGLMTGSGSFESARVQSKHCLQNISVKICFEIENINHKIESFKNQMKRTISRELSTVRYKIQQIFDNFFSDSDKFIRDYVNHYQKKMAAQIIRQRNILEQQHMKIEKMREELNGPQWKKVAGQILSTQLEDRISQLLLQSHQKDIKTSSLLTLEINHIKGIQDDLRQALKLKY